MERPKQFLVYSFVATLVLLLGCLTGCGDSDLSKSNAKEIIQKEIGKCYGLAVPKELVLTSVPDRRYQHVVLARELELVETSQGLAGSPSQDHLTVTLTAKGAATPSFEDIRGNTMFLIAENKVEDILTITKEGKKNFSVLFSYIHKYNSLGTQLAAQMEQIDVSWLPDGTKLRGKASVVYDEFLKQYVVQSMTWSNWEQERWASALFVTNDKKEKVHYHSYASASGIPAASTAPADGGFAREQTRWDTERRRADNQAAIMQERQRENERRNDAREREIEDRRRERERLETKRELERLERQAEAQRIEAARALQRQEQIDEMQRRQKERDLNKKLLR